MFDKKKSELNQQIVAQAKSNLRACGYSNAMLTAMSIMIEYNRLIANQSSVLDEPFSRWSTRTK